MRYLHEQAREIPVIEEVDVLVAGAGPAGIGAAIAASRIGARTLLIERYGFVGGNMTQAMVNPMFTFHDRDGLQVIRGIAGGLVDRLAQIHASPGHVRDLTFDNASMTPFDPEGMKVVLFDMLEEAGVQLLLHCTISDVVREGSRVTALILESKSGRQAVAAKCFVDCTADADVAFRSGAPFILGRESDGAMQPVSLFFRIGGVDNPGLRNWMKANRNELKDSPSDREIDSTRNIALLGLKEVIQRAVAKGEFPADAAPRILLYQLTREDQFAANVTRLQGIDGTNVRDLTRAEIITRRQARDVHRFLVAYVGGFEGSYILDTGVQVGVRETRHIVGDYTLTEQDVLDGAAFEDGIACGTFAIDIHPPEGKEQIFSGSGKAVYEIPYRSLLPGGLDNVLVAGRSISATHNAFGSARVMATCMAIGEGAGVAAAMIAQDGLTSREVDIKKVRKQLIEQGQYLLGESLPLKRDSSLELNRKKSSGGNAGHYNPFAEGNP